MPILRRVYVSVPGDSNLSESQQQLKWALINKLSALEFVPEIFYSERPQSGSLAQGRNWSFSECSAVLRRCVGAIIIGLPRHQFLTEDGPIRLPTEYAHIEGALAVEHKLPTFLLAESGISDRGMFYPGGAHVVTSFPASADEAWTESPKFQNALNAFVDRIRDRRDVFLAYCDTSSGTARNVKVFIEQKEIGATVLDWQIDFTEGRTIIEEIEEAANRTSGGIFLFTRDDALEGGSDVAAPRDNVVFEAGFFAHAKGRERVLIIREDGAKMPADLGGSIYAKLADRSNIGPLEARLKRFLENAI
jgi:hypothetical protein